MEKLVKGILDFRKNVLPSRLETFARLAFGQTPDVLFITCSDSRVAPNWFASTNPGDLFVVRNVGNLVPKCDHHGNVENDHSVAAAIEFSLQNLNVSNIVVCGHSGCGAIQALAKGLESITSTHLRTWLKNSEQDPNNPALTLCQRPDLIPEDRMSQKNVLQQIENLKTYPKIKERFLSGELRLHPWWFDIAQAGVHSFDPETRKFVLIDDRVGQRILDGK